MTEAAKYDDFAALDDRGFSQVAVYFPSMDYVDYLRKDGIHVSDRIDEFLTLIHNENGELVGFKLKGLRNYFLNQLKPALNLVDSDFIFVRDLIVALVSHLGNEFFGKHGAGERKRRAYRSAAEMAANDNVRIGIPMDEAVAA